MQQPTVMHLSGLSGVGKTHLLERFADANPGALQIITPDAIGQRFDVSSVDLATHAGVAIDEVLQWDQATLAAAVTTLEAFAAESGKKLILVTQGGEDLKHHGITLRTSPFQIRIEGPQKSISITYENNHLRFDR